MSAIAQPIPTTAVKRQREPSGWDHLKYLLPYVARYKTMSAIGLLALTLMGIVGSLPQLIIGMITDCLKGSPQALSTLSGTSRAILHPLFALLRPAEPPRAGDLLPDSHGRDARERVSLLLDSLDSDRHLARNRIRSAQ